MNSPVQGESLGAFLTRRREELEAQISALRGQLAPREAELAQIDKTRSMLADIQGSVEASAAPITSENTATRSESTVVLVPSPLLINGRVVHLTIKMMALASLRDHFKSRGATPSEIRDYIKSAYGKDIDRNSIGPQLARLRDQGAVEQVGPDGKWKLTHTGLRYDHPTSWKDMERDEPPDPNAPKTKLADVGNESDRSGVAAVMRPHRDDFLD